MKHHNDVSRRKFLQTAASAGVVAGMATVAMPMTANAAVNARAEPGAKAGPAEDLSRPEHPLEKILSRYGSELGHVNRTR